MRLTNMAEAVSVISANVYDRYSDVPVFFVRQEILTGGSDA